MHDFASLIALWPRPSIRSFADDIGVPYVNAQVMKHRNSIPPAYWGAVVEAADERGIPGVTLDVLQKFSAKRRKPPRYRRGNGDRRVAA